MNQPPTQVKHSILHFHANFFPTNYVTTTTYMLLVSSEDTLKFYAFSNGRYGGSIRCSLLLGYVS